MCRAEQANEKLSTSSEVGLHFSKNSAVLEFLRVKSYVTNISEMSYWQITGIGKSSVGTFGSSEC